MPPVVPRLAPPVRRNLKFTGSDGATNPNPTLSDVMMALSQVQQNQAQILSAIDALQRSLNTLSANTLPAGSGNIW